MRYSIKRYVLPVFLFAAVFLLPKHSDAAWTTETVDSTGNAGQYTSVATDSAGKIHISYYDVTNMDLKYATNATGPWVPSTIASTGNTGQYTSIAVDPQDKVHISYYDVTNGDLKYATNASDIWVAYTVDSTGNTGRHTSIEIDSTGVIHISYYDFTNKNLRHAYGNAASWTLETIDSTGDVGEYSSLAVDTSNNLHISYLDGTNGSLKYAKKSGGAWATEAVDTGWVGYFSSIDTDSSGKAHISYYDAVGLDLKYATDATGQWGKQTIDSAGNTGEYTSLAVDPSNYIHISYWDVTNNDLKYATNLSSSWALSAVDSTGNVGEYSSIAAFAASGIAISYYNSTNQDLKYAVNATPALTVNKAGTGTGTVTSSPAGIDCGGDCSELYDLNTSVTLTAAPSEGSSFTGWSGTCTGSASTCTVTMDAAKSVTATFDLVPQAWTVSVLAPNNGQFFNKPSEHLSLALDASGNPHYAFIWEDGMHCIMNVVYDGSFQAPVDTFTSGDTREPLEGCNNNIGLYLDLDSQGRPHLKYDRPNIGDVKYIYYNGAWLTETVDGLGKPHRTSNSSAFDSNGMEHRCSIENQTLKYSYYDGSAWHEQILEDTIATWLPSCSIALDSSDMPHIIYPAQRYSNEDSFYYDVIAYTTPNPAPVINVCTPESARCVPSEYATIQAAINAAQSDDSILIAQGTYNEHLNITKGGTYTIEGGWNFTTSTHNIASSLTIIDGTNNGRVFYINPAGSALNLTIKDLTVQNGRKSSGDGQPQLSGMNHGGGIFAGNSGANQITLTLQNNTLKDNRAMGSYSDGGAMSIAAVGANITVNMTGNEIVGNRADYDAGGVLFRGYGSGKRITANINGNNVHDNTARFGAGLFFYADGPGNNGFDATITNNTISNNAVDGCFVQSDDFGGATYGGGLGIITNGYSSGNFTLTGNTITGNQAAAGAGIYVGVEHERNNPYYNANMTFNSSNNTITNNTRYAACSTYPTVANGGGVTINTDPDLTSVSNFTFTNDTITGSSLYDLILETDNANTASITVSGSDIASSRRYGSRNFDATLCPDSGWWKRPCVLKNETSLFTYALTVTKSGIGSGTVTSSPEGINCGSTCSANFGQGSAVTLTATASAGSTFAGWSGGCTGFDLTCTVTMDAAKSVTATFTDNSLNVSMAGTGSGTVTSHPAGIDCGGDCSELYDLNTSVTLTAAPATGSSFTGWSGTCTGSASTCTVTMDAAKSVTATFTTIEAVDGFNPNVNGPVWPIAVQTDGKILIGGNFTQISGTTRNNIARLNADGSLDTGFNPNANGYVNSIAVQADGKILIGGWFTTIRGTSRNRIARLNADGSLDASFNPNANSGVAAIALQADGKILIGGYFSFARLNSDGSVDTTFNPNTSNVWSIAVQADGKILIGGFFTTIGGTSRNRIARLNADGSLDTLFNPDADSEVRSIALQADGKILIGGPFTTIGGVSRISLARLNANGSLDTIFNPNLNTNTNQNVYSIAAQADGKILTGGEFTTIGGTPRNYIARLNADGSLDAAFNPNANGYVQSIAVQADGKILVGGYFQTIGGTPRNNIARLNSTEAALQELQVSASTTVRWMRSGAGPELYDVWFESSPNMTSWTMLGTGSRISGGWEINGLSLPLNTNIYIRAKGFAKGGINNSSTSIIESVGVFNLPDLPGYTLTVTKAGTGTVTSSPAGIDCGATCSANFGQGSAVTLTATADAGSTFAGWSGACTGSASTCTVTMNAAKAVTATFTLNTCTITVTNPGNGNGTITSSPPGSNPGIGPLFSREFTCGTAVTLTATPTAGSIFAGWGGGGTCVGMATPCIVSASNTSLTATFALNTYPLTVTKSGTGSGTITSSPAGINCGGDCSELYDLNTSVTLTAAPAEGSSFTGWSGTCTGSASTCTVTMDAAKAVTATFDLVPQVCTPESARCVPSEYATIQAAISAAQSGDSILIAQGTYNEHLSITKGGTYTIEGGWDVAAGTHSADPLLTVINGSQSGRVLRIDPLNSNLNLTIKDLTIQNGIKSAGDGQPGKNQGGGIYADNSAYRIFLELNNNIFRENKALGAYGDGGAISVVATGNDVELSMTGNEIYNNHADFDSGGILLRSYGNSRFFIINMEDNNIHNNTARYGAGMLFYADGPSNGFNATLTNNSITDNSVDACLIHSYDPAGPAFGGGIGIITKGYSLSKFKLIGNTISNNKAAAGAGIYLGVEHDLYPGKEYYNAQVTFNSQGNIITNNTIPSSCIGYPNVANGGGVTVSTDADLTEISSFSFSGDTITGNSLYDLILETDTRDKAVVVTNSSTINTMSRFGNRGHDAALCSDDWWKRPCLLRSETTLTPDTDFDHDGLADSIEQGPDGTNVNYDGNNDGTPDREQANVTSLYSSYLQEYVTLKSSSGALSFVSPNDNPSPEDAPGSEFPYGFFDFTVSGLNPGAQATVTLYVNGAIPDTYYKFGPTPDDPSYHWYEFLYDGSTGADINGNVITLHFVDGELGDDNLTADGIIIDQGGPANTLAGGSIDLDLLSGWNLISLPRQPINTSIDMCLDNVANMYTIIWSYDGGEWKMNNPATPIFNTLDTMEAGKGYWVYMAQPGTMTVSGIVPSNSVQLASGWNLVGYNSNSAQPIEDALASINGKYISVWAFINGEWQFYAPGIIFNTLETMQPGYGYWIYTNQACTWTLP